MKKHNERFNNDRSVGAIMQQYATYKKRRTEPVQNNTEYTPLGKRKRDPLGGARRMSDRPPKRREIPGMVDLSRIEAGDKATIDEFSGDDSDYDGEDFHESRAESAQYRGEPNGLLNSQEVPQVRFICCKPL
jgi:hypothetical protein